MTHKEHLSAGTAPYRHFSVVVISPIIRPRTGGDVGHDRGASGVPGGYQTERQLYGIPFAIFISLSRAVIIELVEMRNHNN